MQLWCQNQYPGQTTNFQAFGLKLQSSRSVLAGKVCHGQSSICRFRVGDHGSILRSQESQPHTHFFLVVFDDRLKQCDQVVLSFRVLFCADLSAEPANQLDVIPGDVTLSLFTDSDLLAKSGRKCSHIASLGEYGNNSIGGCDCRWMRLVSPVPQCGAYKGFPVFL
jgi:hypothetical protein